MLWHEGNGEPCVDFFLSWQERSKLSGLPVARAGLTPDDSEIGPKQVLAMLNHCVGELLPVIRARGSGRGRIVFGDELGL